MTARVIIEAGGHKVDILDDEADATALVELARTLWRATDSADIIRSLGPVGFVAEIPPPREPEGGNQP